MIAGLQKMTLLDYPGKVACTVFLQGCNFRCPFCHNASLLSGKAESPIDTEQLLTFLKKRQGLLDGVCITGGEPTLCPDLPNLMQQIKALGFSVKLDTNGSNPGVLKDLVGAGLVDYVAMDIKNCPQRYKETAGCPGLELSKIEESMVFLMEGTVEYEFRTTVVQEYHSSEDIRQIGLWFQKLSLQHPVEKYFLQSFVDRDSVLSGDLHAPTEAQLQAMKNAITLYVRHTEIRGSQA